MAVCICCELPSGAQRDRLGTHLKNADFSGQHFDCRFARTAHEWIVVGKAGPGLVRRAGAGRHRGGRVVSFLGSDPTTLKSLFVIMGLRRDSRENEYCSACTVAGFVLLAAIIEA